MRYQLERFGFAFVRFLGRILPRSLFLATGRGFGSLAFHLDARHRKVALKNMETALPELSSQNAHEILHQCYRFFGGYLADLLISQRNLNHKMKSDFEFEGLEHLRTAYQEGKGTIIFTAHFGAWELFAIAQGVNGFPMALVTRKLDNPYLEDLLQKFRVCTGNSVIDKKAGFRPMLKTLREGGGIGILIDQNVTSEDRIFVDFFGKPASTTPALALLKLKTDAALIPVFALPLPKDRYRFIYCAPVEVPLTGDRKEDVLRITQECTRVIEDQIRKHPSYWLWMHSRWKTQPTPAQEPTSPAYDSVVPTIR
jgi:KDO2-lipid IV(A) lauroyltransferase